VLLPRSRRLVASMGRTTLAAWAVVNVAVVGASDDCCWCDPTTPATAKTYVDSAAKQHKLVFSDEFSSKDRNFANGFDSKWTALNIGDTSNQGAAFYLPSQATVVEDPKYPDVSALQILTENASHTGDSPTGEKNIVMPFRSAMLQSWNKFCFTSGVVEFRARQPRGSGYWPALWLFGNLGRAVYQNSNTGLWPWSYSQCSTDLELPPGEPPQRISACDDQDAASGLLPFQGRGATELDVLEGAVSNTGKASYVVGSLQLSPGIPPYFRPPMFGFPTTSGPGQWYNGLSFGPPVPGLSTGGFANNGWYGPPWGADCPTGCPDALSGGFVALDDLDTRYWTYTMEWKTGPDGHLSWWYDGEFVWGMAAEAFGEYSVCADRGGSTECVRTPKRMIPEEPMSIVMNTAIGTWNGGKTALDGKHWPAKFFVDYVRVWQEVENIGCDPPNYPTATYIEKHASWYGEPASPLGSETCPEKYPPSAHAHAATIKAAAITERALRLQQAVPANSPVLKAVQQMPAATHAASTSYKAERSAAMHAAFAPASLVDKSASGLASLPTELTQAAALNGAWMVQPTTLAAATSATAATSQAQTSGGLLSSLGLVALGAVGAIGAIAAIKRAQTPTGAQAAHEAEEELRSSYQSTYQAYERMEGLR